MSKIVMRLSGFSMVAFIITKIYLIGKTILVMGGKTIKFSLVWKFEGFTFWIIFYHVGVFKTKYN
jgi:hypothetical protein